MWILVRLGWPLWRIDAVSAWLGLLRVYPSSVHLDTDRDLTSGARDVTCNAWNLDLRSWRCLFYQSQAVWEEWAWMPGCWGHAVWQVRLPLSAKLICVPGTRCRSVSLWCKAHLGNLIKSCQNQHLSLPHLVPPWIVSPHNDVWAGFY